MALENRSFETTLHDVVYSIDSGTGLRIIRTLLYIMVLLLILMVYTATQFRGLKSEEAMDYAQLGRNLSLNEGFNTKCVRPLTIWKMSEQTGAAIPANAYRDLYHPPAYPVVLSAGFRLFELFNIDPFFINPQSRVATMPAEQWVILPINHLFTILTGWIVFRLGKRLFTHEIGLLAMSIYFLSDVAWRLSITGLNISMATFFIAAAFHAIVVSSLNRRENPASRAWIVPFGLSILCAAIAVLTRYIAIAILPGIALYAWLMNGRFRGGTRFAAVFLLLVGVLVSPWLYRNIQVSGHPLGLAGHTALADTAQYPDQQLQRQLNPEFSIASTVDLLKAKWCTTYSEKYPIILGGVLMALFITAFFYEFVRPQVNYLRWGLGLSMLLTLVIAGFFSDTSVLMINAFWPFVILYGLAFFYILIDRLDLGARLYLTGLKILIVLITIIPLFLRIMPPNNENPYPPYWPRGISHVSGWLNEREIMCTDMPWATAWYGNRVSILLPKDVEDFFLINDDYGYRFSGLYVTALTKDKPFASQLLTGPENSWLRIITSGETPPEFPLKAALTLNPTSQDQIFFSDYARWEKGIGQ